MKRKILLSLSLTFLMLFAATAFVFIPSVAAAKSTTLTLNATTSQYLGGTWDSTASTCTIADTATLQSGQILIIPSGTTLVIRNSQGYGIVGFYNYGAVTNYGTITINDGFIGFENGGTVTNYGTITISTIGYNGFTNDGTVNNYGTITISGGLIGFYNDGKVKNSGIITIVGNIDFPNSIGFFLQTGGTVINDNRGTIIISNGGFTYIGFLSDDASNTFTNYGTIIISNSDPGTIGF